MYVLSENASIWQLWHTELHGMYLFAQIYRFKAWQDKKKKSSMVLGCSCFTLFKKHSIAYLATGLCHLWLSLIISSLQKYSCDMQASLPAALGEVHRYELHGNLAHRTDVQTFQHRSHFLELEFSVTGSSRKLDVLCAAHDCGAVFVTHSIWFSHTAMGGPCEAWSRPPLSC